MQVVIDIDDELYNYMKTEEYDEHLNKRFDHQIRFAVKDGTPLPKGHGRLINENELITSNVKVADDNLYTAKQQGRNRVIG